MSTAAVTAFPRRLMPLVEGLPRPYWALWLGMFITRAGSFVVPMLTVYLTRARGFTLAEAGLVLSLMAVGSLVGGTVGGVLADRLGRRVTMLGSLVAGAVCMLAVGFSVTTPQLVVAVFLLGVTQDMFRPAMWAAISDLVAPEHRLRAFGYLYWCINLGFTFAALIAGFMATRNFTLLFVGDAATTLVLAGLIAWAVPETRPERVPGHSQGSLLTPFLDRRFMPFLVLNLVILFVFCQHLTAMPEDMRLKGLSTFDFGTAVAVNGVLIVLLQPSMTNWLKNVPRWRLLAIAAALTGLGFGLNLPAHSMPTYSLAVAVWTFGEIIMAPVNSSVVADLSPAHLRGRYQSAFGFTWSGAMLLAPSLGPAIISHTSMNTFWLLCLGLGLVVAAAHLAFGRSALGDKGSAAA